MSIATYADLVNAVVDYVGDPSVSRRIGDFISLAEAKMNRRLREREMVTKDSAFAITGEYVALPVNFAGVKSFYLNGGTRVVLQPMPDELMELSTSDTPRYYSVEGNSFRFYPVSSGTSSATLIYYIEVPALTSTATTNWAMTNHPDLYLAGVQAEAYRFLKKHDEADLAQAEMYRLLDEIRKASKRDSHSGDALFARPA